MPDKVVGDALCKHLRIMSQPYRKRYGSYDSRGKIKNRVDIDARPYWRLPTGHKWEGDTVIYPQGTRAKAGKGRY